MKKNYMKLLTITILLLLSNNVKASVGPVDFQKSGFNQSLVPVDLINNGDGRYDENGLRIKDDWTLQRAYLSFARTTITNPCPNCTYMLKPHEKEIGWRTAGLIQEFQHITIPESNYPGKYQLNTKRVEVSAVNSTITGTWWID